MLFGGLQKLTTLDFPGVVSALLFTQGCNFHCPYCHNKRLIPANPPEDGEPAPRMEDVLAFLRKRRDVLDGVVISGGEPCMQPGLETFCREAKGLGYKIKLDTNGSFPEVLETLLDASLLDYAAVDVKTAPEAYSPALCSMRDAGEKLAASLALLAASGVPHEARTTCAAPFADISRAAAMIDAVGENIPWFFQPATIGEAEKALGVRALSDAEIRDLAVLANTRRPLARLRNEAV